MTFRINYHNIPFLPCKQKTPQESAAFAKCKSFNNNNNKNVSHKYHPRMEAPNELAAWLKKTQSNFSYYEYYNFD